MYALASLCIELRRRGNQSELDADALRVLASDWRVLQEHAEYPTVPAELQAMVLAGLARTLRRIAMATRDFGPFDEAIPLLKRAQQLSQFTDVDDYIEYRLDELRYRVERFDLSGDRRDVWEAVMCGIRFDITTGGRVQTVGRWGHPGPLRWGSEREDCDFDGAESRNLVGRALFASFERFQEGEDLDQAIAHFELAIPAARFDWAPLREYAVDLTKAYLARFQRLHWNKDAANAVRTARRAVTEIPPDDEPQPAALVALAAALLAHHAAGAPDADLEEAIARARPLRAEPQAGRIYTTGRLIRSAQRHDLAFWVARPPAGLAYTAGEHLLQRFLATRARAPLEAALKVLRLALSRAEESTARVLTKCRLAEAVTYRTMFAAETREAASLEAARYAREARSEAGDDPDLQIQADYALGEALVAPFRTDHDPMRGQLGSVYAPAGQSAQAALAYEAAAKNPAPRFQRRAIEAGVRWSEIALRFSGWPESADAMRHTLLALERFLGNRPSRIEVFEALKSFFGLTRIGAFALAAMGDFAGAIAVIERGRGILRREWQPGEAEAWATDFFDYAGELIAEAAQARDLRRARLTPEEEMAEELDAASFINGPMRAVDERGAQARWEAQVREGRLARSPLRQRALRQAVEAAREGVVVYLIPAHWGLILIVNREGEVKALWPDFFRHVEVIAEARAFYGCYEDRNESPAAFETFKQAFVRLSAWLWDSVMSAVIPAVAPERRLIVVPAGMTGMLPLAVARAGGETDADAGAPYAMDECEIAYTPTIGVYLQARAAVAARGAATALIVDEPTTSKGCFTLTGGERGIVQHFIPSAMVLQGEEAALARVSRHLADFELVHFSAHGEAFIDDPMRSGIFLAGDEMLTVDAFGGGMQLEKIRMVVISACDSATIGRTMPDESVGLPTALLAARIPGVLGTLWAVREHHAFLVVLGFYRAWLGKGNTPAAALAAAQQWVRDSTNEEKARAVEEVLSAEVREGEGLRRLVAWLRLEPEARAFAHPVHWAAFVFSGA